MDLGNTTFRKYGGAGFTLSGLPTEVAATCGRSIVVRDLCKLDDQSKKDLVSALQRLSDIAPLTKAQVIVRQLPPQHIGLGTKTSLLLGALMAASLAAGVRLPKSLLQQISGRGGTSGIGINTFFKGGFLTDAGHNPAQSGGFAPSSSRRSIETPPVLCRVSIPQQWVFYLLLPRGRRFSGSLEQKFFKQNTPIQKAEVLQSIALLYHGVLPAVITDNLTLLKGSIERLQKTGFKNRELKVQPKVVRDIIYSFKDTPECAVGLSSMGPLIYVIANKKNQQVNSQVELVCKVTNTNLLGIYAGRNRGFEVIA
jgi:beta-ribofuranosylaminobenzene 5'-phosphate synthase